MAKKSLIISTLIVTFLTSSITSGATWADSRFSRTGPWNFDEMMSAESEIQDYINLNCPIFGPSHDCFNDYTALRSKENPIYMELHPFETSSFFILSIDTAPNINHKNILEYYYRSEHVLEKYASDILYTYDEHGNILGANYNGESYFHNLTKLYIYQPENGYEADSNFPDYESLASSPYHRTLYSWVKLADGDSLLQVDQKGSIEIEPVSFDPAYARVILYFVEDERGANYTYGTYIYNCHKDDVCAMQYTPYNSYPFLVSGPAYNVIYSGETQTIDTDSSVGPTTAEDTTTTQDTATTKDTFAAPDTLAAPDTPVTPDTPAAQEISAAEDLAAPQNTLTASGITAATSDNSAISPYTPNTGSYSPETDYEEDQKGKIEFPWWLGIIIFLGIITLAWFFLPDSSKKTKEKGLTKIKK